MKYIQVHRWPFYHFLSGFYLIGNEEWAEAKVTAEEIGQIMGGN